ncbi:MAG: CDP-glucose 4,6-dehydratase [Gemmatimonadetes bacterium]|nr:CDP-glucose 4,6-dehydratase [Gemmatimonadota bacterium]
MNVWQGRRVFVTGHTGFKGGWLSLWLHEVGARVSGYGLLPESEPNLFAAAGIDRIVDSTIADVRDLPALREALSRSEAEVVFHLAAQPLVQRGYADPIGTYSTNVMGTAHVLEAARECERVRAVVVVTTDKCYESREWVWGYRENDRLGGDDPYSSSKACAELLAQAYRRSFTGRDKRDLLIATARAGIVFGGGVGGRVRLMPDAVRAFGAGEVLLIRAPHAVRPWQHVLEPLGGYIALAERLLNGEARQADAFNFGPLPGNARSVQEVVDAVAELWGDGAQYRVDCRDYPPETRLLSIDSAKAMTMLDWCPRLDLTTTLKMTVDWYRAHLRGADMRGVTREQVRVYMETRAMPFDEVHGEF